MTTSITGPTEISVFHLRDSSPSPER